MNMHDASQVGATSPDSSLGWAVFGQTFLSLVIVVGVILMIGYALRRLSNGNLSSKRQIKVIASTMVGSKEKVVIIEVKDKWLVLGVGNGNVTRLDRMAKPEGELLPQSPEPELTGTFAQRFGQAIKSKMTP
jgi:flagellar protein FliO/FliZ